MRPYAFVYRDLQSLFSVPGPRDGDKGFTSIMVDDGDISAEFQSNDGASNSDNMERVQPRPRAILEVVIQMTRAGPAYHTTSDGSGTSFGVDAEDDQDCNGDVDDNVERNEGDKMGDHPTDYQFNRDSNDVVVPRAPNERFQAKDKEEYNGQSSESEITAVPQAEAIDHDLDLDSPSSCVTSSYSSDSDNDDLCSIDEADSNAHFERSSDLEWDRDGNGVNLEVGRVSHVFCSVGESDAEDETRQKRFRSSAPSPQVHSIPSISLRLVDGIPCSAACMTSDSNIGASSAMMPSRPNIDTPKIPRKHPRLRLEVSLPHPSHRKRINLITHPVIRSAQAAEDPVESDRSSDSHGSFTAPVQLDRHGLKETTMEKDDEQINEPCMSVGRSDSSDVGWNDGWPGQWGSGKSELDALKLVEAVLPSSQKPNLAEQSKLDRIDHELLPSALSSLDLDRWGSGVEGSDGSLRDQADTGIDTAEVQPTSLSPPLLDWDQQIRSRHAAADLLDVITPDNDPAAGIMQVMRPTLSIRPEHRHYSASPPYVASTDAPRVDFMIPSSSPCSTFRSRTNPLIHTDSGISSDTSTTSSQSVVTTPMDEQRTGKYKIQRTAFKRKRYLVGSDDNDNEEEEEEEELESDLAPRGKGKQRVKEESAGDSSSIDGGPSSAKVKVEDDEMTRSLRRDEEITASAETKGNCGTVILAAIDLRTRIPVPPTAPAFIPLIGPSIAQSHPVDRKAKAPQFKNDDDILDPKLGRSSIFAPSAKDPGTAATPQVGAAARPNASHQRRVNPIDTFLSRHAYTGQRWRPIEPTRPHERLQCDVPNAILPYPPRAVVGRTPTAEEIDTIYIHLQLAPLVHWNLPSNEITGAFLHGSNIWNRVFHPNVKRLLQDQGVVYPVPVINPVYPPEADVIKFQFDKWGAQARVASYKACILGGSDSDNQAMKYLLERHFGGNLSLGYSSFLLQVLASKLDAFGRLGMVDGGSPCRILSTNSLEKGISGEVVTTGDFGEFLRFCSTTLSTGIMAGWFDCQGKMSTYSYTFENRSLRVYSIGGGVSPLFQGYVQVLMESFTSILDLPAYDIDVELLHFAPHAIPPEEGPIAVVILELLVSGKVPHHCLLDMHMTGDRLAVWIPSVRLQQAQYLLDDHAAFKLLDKRLQSLRRMMDDYVD